MAGLFDLGYPATEYHSTRPGYRGTSLQAFYRRFPDADACLSHIFEARFHGSLSCPKCGRTSRWHHIQGTRRFQHSCGQSISPMASTVFNRSNVSLHLWFYAMLHFANSSYGVPTTFLGRHLGISHKAAFRMADRIRLQMAALDEKERVGEPGQSVEIRIEYLVGVRTTRYPVRGSARAVLLGDGKSVQATLIGRPRRHILRKILAEKAAIGAIPLTTCKYTHRVLSEFGAREAEIPLVNEFRDPLTGVNPIKSFLNYLRGPMQNTYRRVDYANLWKYLKECEFGFNRRWRSQDKFSDLVGRFPNLSSARCVELEAWSSRAGFATGRSL